MIAYVCYLEFVLRVVIDACVFIAWGWFDEWFLGFVFIGYL